MIKITNEDNMALMSRYPDKYFDLAIIDIEYGIGASKPSIKPDTIQQKNGSRLPVKVSKYKHKDWDLKKSDEDYLIELFRVSQRQIIFGGNYYGLTGGYLCWDKLNGESDQYGCELAWLSFTNRTDIVYYLWSGMMQGIYCGKDLKKAVIQQGNKKLNEKRIHPTQKPVPLYGYILNQYAEPGDRILDTHSGSGSLAIACDIYGFDLVACELEKDYFHDSISRLSKHQKQQSLFRPKQLNILMQEVSS